MRKSSIPTRRAATRPSLALAIALVAAPVAAQTSPAAPDQATVMATALVAQLRADEKLPQLLNVAPAIPRLDIPAYNWWTESLHGALGPIAARRVGIIVLRIIVFPMLAGRRRRRITIAAFRTGRRAAPHRRPG